MFRGKREGNAQSEGNAGGGVREVPEAKEVEEGVRESRENHANTAAFFDLDGTLMPLPSLEQRFFRMLRGRRAIPAKNFWLWLMEAARLMPRGITAVLQANKMYLRGVQVLDGHEPGNGRNSPGHTSGQQAEGAASAPSSREARHHPRPPAPAFFAEAIERISWHAQRGHRIVLVSGTLEPLARDAARAMEGELAAHGMALKIRVCATRLEEVDGRWTGQILGEAMFGEAKARAVKRLAEEMHLDRTRCYAYGDSLNDWWLLAAVGRPAVANPSRRLASIVKKREWLVVRWNEGRKAKSGSRG